MANFRFKTSINCNSCRSAVTPFLDGEARIEKWDVELDSPDKVLSVEGENISGEEIANLIMSAGYSIQQIK